MAELLREGARTDHTMPGFLPQHQNSNGEFVVTGEKNPHPTKDTEVKAELELVKTELQAIKTRLNETLNTQLTGSYPEYRRLSTDLRPEPKIEEKGAELFLFDTGEIYYNHGNGEWVKFGG